MSLQEDRRINKPSWWCVCDQTRGDTQAKSLLWAVSGKLYTRKYRPGKAPKGEDLLLETRMSYIWSPVHSPLISSLFFLSVIFWFLFVVFIVTSLLYLMSFPGKRNTPHKHGLPSPAPLQADRCSEDDWALYWGWSPVGNRGIGLDHCLST